MKSKNLQITVCYTLIFICAVIITTIGPLVNEMEAAFSLQMAESGVLLMAMFIGFTIFTFTGGVLADRFGKKNVLFTFLGIMTCSLLAISFAGSFWTACVLLLAIGGGAGIMESMSNALLSEIGQEKGTFHVNMVQVVFGIGAFAGNALIGLCLSSGIPWRTIYIALAVLGAVSAILTGATRMPKLPPQDKISFHAFRRLFSSPVFIAVCICLLLYTGSEAGAWGWMATFMKENLAFSKLDSSMSVGVFWLAMVAGRLIVTALMRKLKIRTLILILAFPSAAATLGSAFVTTREMGWVVTVLMGFCYSSIWPLLVSYGSERYKQNTGTVFATFIASGGVGMSTIPLLMGMMGQYINIRTAMALPAVFFLAIGILFLFIERISIRSGLAEPPKLEG